MEISTSVGEGCYFDFLLLKMFIIAAPNTTHFRNDHPRTSSSHLPMDHCQAYWKLLKPKFVAPLSPARKFNSLHLRAWPAAEWLQVTSIGKGCYMAKYILESHPKRTNVASLTGLDLVTFWWNQVCFLLSYQRAQALFDRNHAMRRPPHGEAPRTVWYCSLVGSWILGVRPSSA